MLTSAGAVEVVAPRVNDRRVDPDTGERRRFSSAILPPWARKTPKITEVLPLLYLHGLSSGGFVPALGQFLGSTAGLSGPVITKLPPERRIVGRSRSTARPKSSDCQAVSLCRSPVVSLGRPWSRTDPNFADAVEAELRRAEEHVYVCRPRPVGVTCTPAATR